MKKREVSSMYVLMFYVILLLFMLLFLISCGTQYKLSKSNAPNKLVFDNVPCFEETYTLYGYYSILMIDSCEYVKGWGGYADGGPFITHKGNCKNRIHIYKTDSK